ncbi:unnamed protein product [Brassica oleracea]
MVAAVLSPPMNVVFFFFFFPDERCSYPFPFQIIICFRFPNILIAIMCYGLLQPYFMRWCISNFKITRS